MYSLYMWTMYPLCLRQSVCLHAQLQLKFDSAIWLNCCPCPSIHELRENWFIVWLHYGRRRYALFSWLLFDLLPVSQANYKQVSRWLAKSLLNSENMDNFTALYTSYLRFTFGTNSMHASPCANRIFVFLLTFFYKFMLLEFRVKDRHVDYPSCRDCWGPSGSSWGVNMQE